MIENLSKFIDHTYLKPEATERDIRRVVKEAIEYNFATVFVAPSWTKLAKELLKGSGVKLGCPIGFPFGASATETKIFEAKKALADGAEELDMVINIGRLKSGDYQYVEREIKEVVKAVKPILIKIIIETGYLTDEEKIKVSLIAKEAGADFVKTSTGILTTGAKVEDIRLLKKVLGDYPKIKASGGIRDYKTCLELIEAGAERIGTSSGVKIMEEYLLLKNKEAL
ncbi:MAG: deoxyribose-phosphate aldolase [candidate division WOR-3 bacterium]